MLRVINYIIAAGQLNGWRHKLEYGLAYDASYIWRYDAMYNFYIVLTGDTNEPRLIYHYYHGVRWGLMIYWNNCCNLLYWQLTRYPYIKK